MDSRDPCQFDEIDDCILKKDDMDIREDCDSRDRADFVWECCNGRELKSNEIVVLKNKDDDVLDCSLSNMRLCKLKSGLKNKDDEESEVGIGWESDAEMEIDQ